MLMPVRWPQAVANKAHFPIFYRPKQVGLYVADLVVDDTLIAELKAVEGLVLAHGKAKLEIRRVIL